MAANDERDVNVLQVVKSVETDFNALASIHGAVNFQRECAFALQILKANDFLMGVARGDQDSLKTAVLNVAAVGLSLSPVHKLAYLVPRNKKVCLDISYQGHIQLALDAGAIMWAKAELVFSNDTFELAGINEKPLHKFQPFGDRGEFVGVYSVAKTHDGEFYVDHMTRSQIEDIRDRSESYKAFIAKKASTTPWETDWEEMTKKTMIRRAYKSWAKRDSREESRMLKAIDVTNDIDFSQNIPAVAHHGPELNVRSLKIENIREKLKDLNREESKFIDHAVRVFRRDIKSIEEFTDNEISQAIIMLDQFIELKKTSDAKKLELEKGAKNENAG